MSSPEQSERAVHPLLRPISSWISSVGAAVALGDINGDGLDNDCVIVDPRTNEVRVVSLINNNYTSFVLEPGICPYNKKTMAPMGTLIGDFNEDCLSDILVYFWGRSPIVYLQQKGPDEKSLSSRLFLDSEFLTTVEYWFTNAATQADIDGDGHIDLIFGNYFRDGSQILDENATNPISMQDSMSRAHNGGPSRIFFYQEGAKKSISNSFIDVSSKAPQGLLNGWTLAIGCADLDGDLLPEIYFANDFGEDRLFHNRSTPGNLIISSVVGHRYATTPGSKVLGKDSFKGMGIDFGDINGDGIFDLYVSNIAKEYALHESHYLFQSTGNKNDFTNGHAPFEDVSDSIGLSRSSWGWDCKLADFDNDGVLEAVQAVGFVKGTTNRWPELQELAMTNDSLIKYSEAWMHLGPGSDLCGADHNPFFVRGKSGRFIDISKNIGIGQPNVSRGIALADVDNDGFIDMVVANQWSDSVFYHNSSPKMNSSMTLHLLRYLDGMSESEQVVVNSGSPTPHQGVPAIGTIVRIYRPNGTIGVMQVDGGNGHSGKRSATIHCGLGSVPEDTIINVDVTWRDGLGLHSQRLHLPLGENTLMLPSPQSKGHK